MLHQLATYEAAIDTLDALIAQMQACEQRGVVAELRTARASLVEIADHLRECNRMPRLGHVSPRASARTS